MKQRNWRQIALPLLLALLLGAVLAGPMAWVAQAAQVESKPRPGPGANGGAQWEKQGLQVGQSIPDLVLQSPDGKKQSLSEICSGKPTLIVTVSLTCPVARRTQPQVEEVARKFSDQLQVVILYTIEAHPQTDPSPYSGKEWVTPANEQAGILHRQPKVMEQRGKLAQEFQKRLAVQCPIFMDGMDNKSWKALGGGPNMGLLVGPDGKLIAKQGWLKPQEMTQAIQEVIRSKKDEG